MLRGPGGLPGDFLAASEDLMLTRREPPGAALYFLCPWVFLAQIFSRRRSQRRFTRPLKC